MWSLGTASNGKDLGEPSCALNLFLNLSFCTAEFACGNGLHGSTPSRGVADRSILISWPYSCVCHQAVTNLVPAKQPLFCSWDGNSRFEFCTVYRYSLFFPCSPSLHLFFMPSFSYRCNSNHHHSPSKLANSSGQQRIQVLDLEAKPFPSPFLFLVLTISHHSHPLCLLFPSYYLFPLF